MTSAETTEGGRGVQRFSSLSPELPFVHMFIIRMGSRPLSQCSAKGR